MTSGRVYLYLARRDKRGIQILAVLDGDQRTGRVSDIKSLGLSPNMLAQVERQVYENRMMWELFVEGAADYISLRNSLYKRGYTGLPASGQPLLASIAGQIQPVNTSQVSRRRVMLQR